MDTGILTWLLVNWRVVIDVESVKTNNRNNAST